jgi:hypothetical protein
MVTDLPFACASGVAQITLGMGPSGSRSSDRTTASAAVARVCWLQAQWIGLFRPTGRADTGTRSSEERRQRVTVCTVWVRIDFASNDVASDGSAAGVMAVFADSPGVLSVLLPGEIHVLCTLRSSARSLVSKSFSSSRALASVTRWAQCRPKDSESARPVRRRAILMHVGRGVAGSELMLPGGAPGVWLACPRPRLALYGCGLSAQSLHRAPQQLSVGHEVRAQARPGERERRSICALAGVRKDLARPRALATSWLRGAGALMRERGSGTQRREKGAGNRVRTGDIQLGKLTLYQLSYARTLPTTKAGGD